MCLCKITAVNIFILKNNWRYSTLKFRAILLKEFHIIVFIGPIILLFDVLY